MLPRAVFVQMRGGALIYSYIEVTAIRWCSVSSIIIALQDLVNVQTIMITKLLCSMKEVQ